MYFVTQDGKVHIILCNILPCQENIREDNYSLLVYIHQKCSEWIQKKLQQCYVQFGSR